jgi:hypothetical protein
LPVSDASKKSIAVSYPPEKPIRPDKHIKSQRSSVFGNQLLENDRPASFAKSFDLSSRYLLKKAFDGRYFFKNCFVLLHLLLMGLHASVAWKKIGSGCRYFCDY